MRAPRSRTHRAWPAWPGLPRNPGSIFRAQSLVGFVLFLTASCAGGTCAGGAGVDGEARLGPVPDGFPAAARLDGAGQLRLSRRGLQTVADEVDLLAAADLGEGMMGGPVDLPVPQTRGREAGIDFTLCRNDDCRVRLEVAEVGLESTPPDEVAVRVGVTLDSRDAAGERAGLPVRFRGLCVLGACVVNTRCTVDVDTRRGDRETVELATGLALPASTVPPREGLLAAAPTATSLPPDRSLERRDVAFRDCSGISGAILELFSGPIEGAIIDAVESEVPSLVDEAVADLFCARPEPASGVCPGATTPVPAEDLDAAVCRADDDAAAACLPPLLGIEGRGDLGAAFLGDALGGAPATPGELLFAVGGPAEASRGGLNLPLVGGLRTSADFTFPPGTEPAHHPCVPVTEPPPLPEGPLPAPPAILADVLPGTDVPVDLAFSLAEPFFDRALWSLFDGGALCLTVDHRVEPSLTTGLLSLLLPSLGELAFPAEVAPIQLALRPGAPPELTFSEDPEEPLLQLGLPAVAVDLYVWTAERYLRALTYRVDLTLALDLVVDGENTLVPELQRTEATGGQVIDAPLLREDPAVIGRIFDEAVGALAEGLGSAFPPVALPPLPGLSLFIPEGGEPRVVLGDDGVRHLAVFADLLPREELAASGGAALVDTQVLLEELHLEPEGMTPKGFGRGPGNRATVRVAALPGGRPPEPGDRVEHSVRLGWGPWSRWQEDPVFVLDEPRLRFAGRHRVEARARLAGAPRTADRTPAVVDLRIERPGSQDEASSVPPSSAGGCAVRRDPGDGGGRGSGWWPPLLLCLALLTLRARRGKRPRNTPTGGGRCRRLPIAVLAGLLVGPAAGGCSSSSSSPPMPTEMPEPPEPLEPGILASQLDAEVAPGGQAVWLVGYAPGIVGGRRYGDLVFGVLDPEALRGDFHEVTPDWEIVDGVPPEPPVGDPRGWRGGVQAAGDDVGRFPQLAVAADGSAVVAYQDASRPGVRMARGRPGGPWSVHRVDDDSARPVAAGPLDLALTADGRPVVLHRRVDPNPDRRGTFVARLVLRVSRDAAPDAPEAWETRSVDAAPAPCRPAWCADGEVCFVDDGRCAPPEDDCAAACPEGSACRGGSCQPVREPPFVEARPTLLGSTLALGLVPGTGTADVGQVAVIIYERPTEGQVLVRTVPLPHPSGGGAGGETHDGPRLLLAGADVDAPDPRRRGGNVAVDLRVEPVGDPAAPPTVQVVWVARDDALMHARVQLPAADGESGRRPELLGSARVVDDGVGDPDTGERFPDGRHRIGRDARLAFGPGLRAWVLHQDATSARLRRATLADPREDDRDFDPGLVLDGQVATGFHPFQVALPDGAWVVGSLHRDPMSGTAALRVRLE